MKSVLLLVAALLLVACTNNGDDADSERQANLKKMYKTPPASDRSKNKEY